MDSDKGRRDGRWREQGSDGGRGDLTWRFRSIMGPEDGLPTGAAQAVCVICFSNGSLILAKYQFVIGRSGSFGQAKIITGEKRLGLIHK